MSVENCDTANFDTHLDACLTKFLQDYSLPSNKAKIDKTSSVTRSGHGSSTHAKKVNFGKYQIVILHRGIMKETIQIISGKQKGQKKALFIRVPTII